MVAYIYVEGLRVELLSLSSLKAKYSDDHVASHPQGSAKFKAASNLFHVGYLVLVTQEPSMNKTVKWPAFNPR